MQLALNCRRLALCALLCFAVQAAPQGLRREDVYREFGYIRLKDGTRLAYVNYRPHKEGRYPVVLIYEPYWGGGLEIGDEEWGYLTNGFAVVGVNLRGTGCSSGVYHWNSRTQGPDGAEAVDWAGTQPWSTGNVGMYGNSYPGLVQFYVAPEHPKHLRALAAGGLIDDSYQDVVYPGGIFNSGFIAQWAYSTQDRVSAVGVAYRKANGDTACDANRAEHQPNDAFSFSAAHPLDGPDWALTSPITNVAKINVPTLITQGWQDQQTGVRGGVRLFEALTSTKRLVLSNGRHEIFKIPALRVERVRWFNRWLKGEKNGIENEPRLTVLFETRAVTGKPLSQLTPNDFKPGWSATFATYPIPGTQWKTLYLTADGKLNGAPPAAPPQAGERRWFYPSGTEIVLDNATFGIPPVPPGHAAYRSSPAAQDTAIIGTPVVTLYMSSEQRDTDMMAVLHDVDPQGNVMYLQRGFLRASLRGVDPSRSKPHAPYLPMDRSEPLAPGKVYEFKIPLFPLGHVLRAGHRLELDIMAPPQIPLPNWGFSIVPYPGMNTIYHSARQPSTLELPIIPGLKPKAPAAPCGSIDLQPCRPGPRP